MRRNRSKRSSASGPASKGGWTARKIVLASLVGAALVVAVAVARSSGRSEIDAAGQLPASTMPASTEPPAATTEPEPAPTTEAATPSSEQVETDTSEAVETVPTTSIAPTTSQPEETGSETETMIEEEESIAVDPAYIARSAAILQFTEECGFLDTTNSDYREYDDPEDTQALEQMGFEQL